MIDKSCTVAAICGPSAFGRRGRHAALAAWLLLPAISFAQAVGAPAAAPATTAPAQTLAPAEAALQARQDRLQTAIVKRDAQAVRELIR